MSFQKLVTSFKRTGIFHWYREEHDLFGIEAQVEDVLWVEAKVDKWLKKNFDLELPKMVYGSKCVHLSFKVDHPDVATVRITTYESSEVGCIGLRVTLDQYRDAKEMFAANQAAQA